MRCVQEDTRYFELAFELLRRTRNGLHNVKVYRDHKNVD